jgi:hypothetical protein
LDVVAHDFIDAVVVLKSLVLEFMYSCGQRKGAREGGNNVEEITTERTYMTNVVAACQVVVSSAAMNLLLFGLWLDGSAGNILCSQAKTFVITAKGMTSRPLPKRL